MFVVVFSFLLIISTVSPIEDGVRRDPYKEMEVRVVVRCHIPGANKTKFEVTLMEENRGEYIIFYL